MTNELAYEILKGIIKIIEEDANGKGSEEGELLTVECLKMALSALEKQLFIDKCEQKRRKKSNDKNTM